MTDLNDLTAQEIGRRLRVARENANVKQDDAAQVIGMSRPTLISIEQGVRRVRIKEIQILAQRYGVSVNSILRREAVHNDLGPRFRKLRETEDAYTTEAATILNNLVKAEVELENILGRPTPKNYPPERGINSGDVIRLAEQHAQELRTWLGLGPGPINNIFSIIELNLGIRLFQRRLDKKSKVAGLFAYDDEVGACILLNANHPLPRRVQTAAHELGHFYGTRRNAEVLEVGEEFLSREERYANAFGYAFLTPKESFTQSFEKLKISSKLTRRLVILLAHQYNISRQACVLRLEDLGLAKEGTWEWFETNGGITDEQAQAVLVDSPPPQDPVKSDADRVLSQRLSLMAHAAWDRGLMTEGQLVELLKIPTVELREVIDQIALEEKADNDDILKFPGQ